MLPLPPGRLPDRCRARCWRPQLPESRFQEVKDLILNMTRSSNRSGMPAIYGIVAAAEVERLKPLSDMPAAQVTAAAAHACCWW